MSQPIEVLQSLAVFAGLTRGTLEFLLARAKPVVVDAGHYFFREGDAGCALYVLESGHVEALKARDGKVLHLASLGPGDCVGEMALLAVTPRSASVRATTRCEALRIENGDLRALYTHDLEQFAMIMMNMGREVCRRLYATDELLFRVAGLPAMSNVALSDHGVLIESLSCPEGEEGAS